MKTIIKTIILIAIVILGLFIGIKIYYNSGNETEESVLDISPSDPTVQLLMKKIYSSNIFRSAGFNNNSLNDDIVISYGIDNITKDNYSSKTIKHKKSLCEVTGKILFTSTDNCNIRIINKDYFTKLIKNDFNVDYTLTKDTFTYHGYFCKSDSKKYYCLMSRYTNYDKNLSLIKNAYEEGNKLIIYEYYLYVDLNNNELCNLYLNSEYCANKKPNDEIKVEDDVIINNGVLYRHEFVKEEDKYYYLQSFIVSER